VLPALCVFRKKIFLWGSHSESCFPFILFPKTWFEENSSHEVHHILFFKIKRFSNTAFVFRICWESEIGKLIIFLRLWYRDLPKKIRKTNAVLENRFILKKRMWWTSWLLFSSNHVFGNKINGKHDSECEPHKNIFFLKTHKAGSTTLQNVLLR
jgi:hypothetical protein